ncbi:MAG: NHL repeat-containing protein [Candidatus Dormiibacterota bacterium]
MTPRLGKMVAVGAFAGSLALLGMQSVSGVALASGTNPRTASLTAPSYLTTLAGASIANMYSSGFAWDPVNHRIVVADTGNNRIEFYNDTTSGAQFVSAFGSFGSGDGQFNSPREVAIDGSGNIYVADAGNNRVEAFTSSGTFRWASQDQPGWTNSTGGCLYPERSTVCLNQPIGVGWDSVLNQLLVADTGDSYIKAFSLSGSGTAATWISTSPSGKSILGFTNPRGVTRGPGGYIWVSAYEQNQIKAYQVTGSGLTQTWTLKVTLGSTAGHGNNQLSFPYNVAFSPDGTYAYVSDIGNDRIAVYNISNLNSPMWLGQYGSRCNQPCGDPGVKGGDTGKFAFLRRVLVEGADGPHPGAVFGDDFWGNGMNAWNPPVANVLASVLLEQVDGVHAPAPGFAQAFGVAVGPGTAPDVYGVDRLNQRMEQFVQSTNAFVTASGVRGSTKVADGFSWPEDVAVAPDGTVWLADTRNSRLQHWPTMSVTGVYDVGTKGSGKGQFNYIEGLTVDGGGNVWVADTNNNRIEECANPCNATGSTFQTFGGPTPGTGVCQFNNPQSVAVGPTGQIYVADTLNNRIDEFTISDGSCNPSSWITYSGSLNGPQGVTVAGDGTVWVADSGNNAVVHLDASLNNLGDGFGGPTAGMGTMQFDDPHSLAVFDNIGTGTHTLYVADTYNNRIQEFNIAGA